MLYPLSKSNIQLRTEILSLLKNEDSSAVYIKADIITLLEEKAEKRKKLKKIFKIATIAMATASIGFFLLTNTYFSCHNNSNYQTMVETK